MTSPTRAFDHPAFRRYYIGLWFSTHAFWMLRIAIGWSAWETSGSAFATGLVASLSMLPAAFLAPLFGVVTDRVRLRIAVPLVVALFAGIAILLALLSFADQLRIELLVLVAGTHGLVAAFWQPIRLILPARLVPRHCLPETVGYSSMIFQMSRITGPAIAGLLIASYGIASVFVLVALAYGAFLYLFLSISLNPRTPHSQDADPFLARFLSGLRVAAAMRDIRPTLVATLLNALVARAALELLPAIAGGVLDSGATALAWLTSAAGIGAIAGGFITSKLPNDSHSLRRRFVVTGAAAASATLALGFADGLIVSGIACAFIGLFATLTGVGCQGLLQLTVDDAYRGRVLSLWTMSGFGGAVIGTLALGALGDRLGLSNALIVLGSVGIIAFGCVAYSSPGPPPPQRRL